MAEGVTTVEIKSGYGLSLEDELKQLRAARRLQDELAVEVSATLLAAHALPPEYAGRPDAYIDYIVDVILPAAASEAWPRRWTLSAKVGFSPAQTRRVFEAARAHGLKIKGHVEQLSNLHGAELVAEFGGWSADHVEYLDAAGVAALKAAGTVAVLLPGAFYFLRETQSRRWSCCAPPACRWRCPPIQSGTSPFASIRLAMNQACVLFGLTPEEALAGVTRHAAQALGRGASHGRLAAGQVADLLLWDIDSPAEIVYGLGDNPFAPARVPRRGAAYERLLKHERGHECLERPRRRWRRRSGAALAPTGAALRRRAGAGRGHHRLCQR